jgi:hypothetical protein
LHRDVVSGFSRTCDANRVARMEVAMRSPWLLVLLVLSALTLTGCEAIAGIFKAGMWTGVIGIVLVLVVVGFIAAKIRG